MNVIKKTSYSDEPVFVTTDGNQHPYIPLNVKTARATFGASLHLMFQHVSDMHILILTILAEKYGHNIDEMFAHIHNDPRYTSMIINPAISSMGYFEEEDLTRAMKGLTMSEPEPPQPKKKILKKAVKKTTS